MAQQQWELEGTTGRCAATGRAFEEGEEFYTVLFEQGESFTRADYSLEGWTEPPERAFCYFKTRVPVKEKKKKLLVDNELLINFFARLADETEPVRVQFRFVLALILMRKRLLRYETTVNQDGVEVWEMTLPRDQSPHRVVNPHLTDDQIEAVSRELTAILHGDALPPGLDDEGMDVGDESSPQDRQDADDQPVAE